ncbi:MAG TPA: hypothetical protein VLX92_28670, partial [Kofleriaceae bacterium]|nr:hypothetical protein [Kofleriaceae bacterium]
YAGERLDTLFVAKMLAPPAQPGGRTRLLDGAGRELDTEYYWKTRIARRDDLTIGQLAFCQAPAYLDKASAPKTRAIARTEPWMMGRISNVAQLDSGQVSVANVVCDLAGVRVIAR